ncbi:MAG: hypothetical protein LBK76_11765 [Verrucomicrobiales bacterium]|jgi:hypothetical protein|nr:hypothetical protein [Verrucomicrobiales bacterium]
MKKKFLLMKLSLLLVVACSFAQEQAADNAEQPQTNVYAIVKSGDGRLQVIRAKEVEKKDPALVITDEEDRHTARQLNMLIDIIPFYVDEDQSLPDDNIQNIVLQYDNLIKNYPELKKRLVVDRTKYQEVLDARKLQQAEKEKQKEQALKDFTVEQFVDANDYKSEDLEARITAGAQFKTQYPDTAATIDEYLKPWLDRQALLKEGKVKWDGEWRTRQEIQQIQETRRAERLKTFIEHIKPAIVSNTVATQQTMTIVAIFLVASALVALFSFYYAVFQSRIGGFLEFIMLVVSVIFMGFYAFYVVRIFNAPGLLAEYAIAHGGKAEDGAAPVEIPLDRLYKLLYISQGDTLKDLEKADLSVTLGDAEVNEAINKLVQFRQDTISGSLGVAMEKMKFYTYPTKLRFLQQTSCLGKNFLLRYDLHFQINNDAITFYKCDVYIGDTILPSAIGNRLWLQFYHTLKEVLRAFNVSRNYQLQKIEDGKLTVGYVLPGTS